MLHNITKHGDCFMKKIFLFVSILFIFPLLMSFSNAKVITEEDGSQIVIFPDGTWKEFRGDIRPKTQEQKFILGGKQQYGIWYNPNVWTVPVTLTSSDYDIEFVHASEGAYGYILFNENKIPQSKLRDFALHNARQIIDEMKVTVDNEIEINNTKVLCMQIEGWYTKGVGVQVVYCGYYYTGARGSIQFVVYTTGDLFPAIQQDIKSLLDGFVIVPR